MKILYAVSEAYPFIKTGGLGDVAYALPKALSKLGLDVRVILPKYSEIPLKYLEKMIKIAEFNIQLGWRNQYCGLFKLEEEGISFYFIDNEYYFKRAKPYGDLDDGEKFSFFSKAVLEAINYMEGFSPDVLHCNDWHTAIAIPLLKEHYSESSLHSKIKTILTIHNLKYQGVFEKEMLHEMLNLREEYFSEDRLKFYDRISFLKGGIMFADAINTVSITYAEEIKTEDYGEGLHGLLYSRSKDLYGIVNGLDTELNDPRKDKSIFYNYDENSFQLKKLNKEQLQKKLGLPINIDIPVVGMVTRLEEQKGLELIEEVIDEILKEDIQLIVLGTGNKKYEDMFRYYETNNSKKLSANLYFDGILAQQIYSASDIFLMPSKFEPCGIGQLIALRYGSIPIVRETGGLNDTVFSYNEHTGDGNGFSFKNFNSKDMLYTIRRVIKCYYQKEVWSELVERAIKGDYSWNKSAQEYLNMYNNII
ncbi:glycogen synthase [Clostridium homopropionicum DSM 5847]|uniref:Glycogen synthase n=1 Tax=Clostridium homopropionicum DSM 5847 TaxID=1121318 RepID=A0A0L6Z9M4_9CLOT|nr:glycogen synthase GlgA [Clostridium homopropionicum]KOA19665.1 glycogen synthase [Clostridium homopropionicum DSM 5847]SFF80548.1 starch synthase [Clostridium homopropionicum]